MATRLVDIPNIGSVTLQKHRRSRSLKITLLANGGVRVSLPMWVPYKTAVDFAKSREAWIREHRHETKPIEHGQMIGKAHHVYFLADAKATKASSRLKDNAINITHPRETEASDLAVQKVAKAAIMRVLKAESENLLPQRLATLARQHGFTYASVSVRQLKARWGSCNNKQEITLNIFLMQLPWNLIDYVLIHELVHTKHLHHGPDFWAEFERIMPDAKARRKTMRTHKPAL